MLIRIILKGLDNVNYRIIKIVNIGLCVSLITGLIGILLILTYNTYSVTYDYYKAGFILIRMSLLFSAQFLACGLAFQKIIKERR